MSESVNKHSDEYDDSYPTCNCTYASLCITLPEACDPVEFSHTIKIEPSRIQRKGERYAGKINNWPTAWFLSSDQAIDSRDLRRHIDWLIDQLVGKEEIIHQVQVDGGKLVLSCYWVSATGYGGPILSPWTMRRLSDLGIEIWFDFYMD